MSNAAITSMTAILEQCLDDILGSASMDTASAGVCVSEPSGFGPLLSNYVALARHHLCELTEGLRDHNVQFQRRRQSLSEYHLQREALRRSLVSGDMDRHKALDNIQAQLQRYRKDIEDMRHSYTGEIETLQGDLLSTSGRFYRSDEAPLKSQVTSGGKVAGRARIVIPHLSLVGPSSATSLPSRDSRENGSGWSYMGMPDGAETMQNIPCKLSRLLHPDVSVLVQSFVRSQVSLRVLRDCRVNRKGK
jgi:hypothetical protein